MLVGVAVSDVNPHQASLSQVVEHYSQVRAMEFQPEALYQGRDGHWSRTPPDTVPGLPGLLADLKFKAVHAPTRGRDITSLDMAHRAWSVAETKGAMDYAHELGADAFTLHPGQFEWVEPRERRTRWEIFLRSLMELSDHYVANGHGYDICIENREYPKFPATVEEVRTILKEAREVSAAPVKLCVDIPHLWHSQQLLRLPETAKVERPPASLSQPFKNLLVDLLKAHGDDVLYYHLAGAVGHRTHDPVPKVDRAYGPNMLNLAEVLDTIGSEIYILEVFNTSTTQVLDSVRHVSEYLEGTEPVMLDQVQYYRDVEVRRRIAEYCGGTYGDPKSFRTQYLVGYGEALTWEGGRPFRSVQNEDLDWLMEKGLDIFRSVWSRNATLIVLDVEYYNHDYPGEPYYHPERVYGYLEPVYRAIEGIYERYGIDHITLMTGQGYHFTSLVPRESPAHAELESLGNVAPTLASKYAHVRPGSRRKRAVAESEGRAYDGAGRLLEFLAHEVLRTRSEVPILISDVDTGHSPRGRDGISIDLTQYADPVFMRDLRVPFSTHQKHKVQRHKVGSGARFIPVQVALPRRAYKSPTSGEKVEFPLDHLFRARRSFRESARIAAHCSVRIPDGSEGWARVAQAYRKSQLFRFHRAFDAVDHDPWEVWPRTYDAMDLGSLPPCVAHPLRYPNPHLLKPTNLQTLTRVLVGKGWHPKHVAGLIRSKYERDYGWEEDWFKYDAGSRANFWVRVYAGLIATGVDTAVDFNCISHQEKGYCSTPWCGHNLGDYQRGWAPLRSI